MPVKTRYLTLAAVLGVMFALTAAEVTVATTQPQVLQGDGVVKVKSAYGFEDTISRIRKDVDTKGIMQFGIVEQSKLAAAAGITLAPSTLIVFGNPGLGNQFLTSNPSAGLDWPVRLLVTQDPSGQVWAHYTDFRWIADRHRIRDRDAQFQKATEVIASITSSVSGK